MYTQKYDTKRQPHEQQQQQQHPSIPKKIKIKRWRRLNTCVNSHSPSVNKLSGELYSFFVSAKIYLYELTSFGSHSQIVYPVK